MALNEVMHKKSGEEDKLNKVEQRQSFKEIHKREQEQVDQGRNLAEVSQNVRPNRKRNCGEPQRGIQSKYREGCRQTSYNNDRRDGDSSRPETKTGTLQPSS